MKTNNCLILSMNEAEGLSHYTYDPKEIDTDYKCMKTCCDYIVLVIDGLHRIRETYSNASKFYMYTFINMKAGEDPDKITTDMENFIIFQLPENAPNVFTIHDRKRDKIEKIAVWDGHQFIDNNFVKSENLVRDLRGEVLRIGSGTMMPLAYLWTNQDGSMDIGSGRDGHWRVILGSTVDIG